MLPRSLTAFAARWGRFIAAWLLLLHMAVLLPPTTCYLLGGDEPQHCGLCCRADLTWPTSRPVATAASANRPGVNDDDDDDVPNYVKESASFDELCERYAEHHARILRGDVARESDRRFLVVLYSRHGIGNRMQSFTSALLVAMLTGRALLVDWPDYHAVARTSQRLPIDLDIHRGSLLGLLPAGADAAAAAAAAAEEAASSEEQAARGDELFDRLWGAALERLRAKLGSAPQCVGRGTTCYGHTQRVRISSKHFGAYRPLECDDLNVAWPRKWLLVEADQYFAPFLWINPHYGPSLSRVFGGRDRFFALLAGAIFEPVPAVTELAREQMRGVREGQAAGRRSVCLQLRYWSDFFDEEKPDASVARSLRAAVACDSCSRRLLARSNATRFAPSTVIDAEPCMEAAAAATTTATAAATEQTTVFVIMSLTSQVQAVAKQVLGEDRVFVPSKPSERQVLFSAAHDRQALADLLSIGDCDVRITTFGSTFGYVGTALSQPTASLFSFSHHARCVYVSGVEGGGGGGGGAGSGREPPADSNDDVAEPFAPRYLKPLRASCAAPARALPFALLRSK